MPSFCRHLLVLPCSMSFSVFWIILLIHSNHGSLAFVSKSAFIPAYSGHNVAPCATRRRHWTAAALSQGNEHVKMASSSEASSLDQAFSQNNLKAIDGLLSNAEFHRLDAIHETLHELSYQIPALLTAPLSEQSAQRTYTQDTRLVVAASSPDPGKENFHKTDNNDIDIELASSREELLSLCNAFVLALTASNRAGDFLAASQLFFPLSSTDLLGKPQRKSSTASLSDQPSEAPVVSTVTRQPLVETEIFVTDASTFTRLQVDWQTRILIPLLDPKGGTLQGRSELILDVNETGKVKTHRLLQVSWNGKIQDARAIGQALATLRSSLKSLQQSPIFQTIIANPSTATATNRRSGDSLSTKTPLNSLFEVGRDWVQQQLLPPLSGENASPPDSSFDVLIKPAPIYVFERKIKHIQKNDGTVEERTIRKRVLIDEYTPFRMMTDRNNSTNYLMQPPPLPGSQSWRRYAAVHQLFQAFVYNVIPILSGQTTNYPQQKIQSLFSSNAKLVTLDQSLLLQGCNRVANFYESLAVFRRRALGDWHLEKASVCTWDGQNGSPGRNPCIQIDYTASIQLPGVTKAFQFQGTDIYELSSPRLRDPLDRLEENEIPQVIIIKVQQTNLVADNGLSKQDAILFLKSLATAVETGRNMGGLKTEDDWVTDLLLRLTRSSSMNNQLSQQFYRSRRMIQRSDAAAATVYRIMDSLLTVFPEIVQYQNSAKLQSSALVPALDFMTDDMELLGYLDEILLRSRSTYERNWLWWVSWLQLALRTGRLVLAPGHKRGASNSANSNDKRDDKGAEAVKVRVELTQQRNIRAFMSLNLLIPSTLPDWATSSFPSSLSGGLPFKLYLVSEYILDESSGRIVAHRLMESRVNGQLTPGDVVARLVNSQRRRRWPNEKYDSDEGAMEEESLIKGIMETVTWVRSLGTSPNGDNDFDL